MAGPFAKTLQGSPGTTDTSPDALILDKQNNVVYSLGDSQMTSLLECVITERPPQAALSAITTAQNLATVTINKNLLNYVNRVVEITGILIYTSPGTTTPTITIAVTLGGVTLCSISPSALNSVASTNMPINFWFTLMTVTGGSAGTIESHGQVNANLSANNPAAAVSSFNDTNTAVSSAINLTAAQTLNVTIAASVVIPSAQLRLMTVEVIN